MNPFRLAGDLSHLLAIIVLLVKIWQSRSCSGKELEFSECLETMHLLIHDRYIGEEPSALRVGIHH